MNFPGGIPEQKFNVNRACFPKGKTPEFTKMGEIHELFVLPLSLVWFAGATPRTGRIATTLRRKSAIFIWNLRNQIAIASNGDLHLQSPCFFLQDPVGNRSDFRPAVDIRNRKKRAIAAGVRQR